MPNYLCKALRVAILAGGGSVPKLEQLKKKDWITSSRLFDLLLKIKDVEALDPDNHVNFMKKPHESRDKYKRGRG